MSDDVLSQFVKFSNQTSGQDKICRLEFKIICIKTLSNH